MLVIIRAESSATLIVIHDRMASPLYAASDVPPRKRAAMAARAAAAAAAAEETTIARSRSPSNPVCTHCGATKTPLWRKGPNGRNTLCNACGTRWKRSGSLALRRPLGAAAAAATGSHEDNRAVVSAPRLKRVKQVADSAPLPPVMARSKRVKSEIVAVTTTTTTRGRGKRPKVTEVTTNMPELPPTTRDAEGDDEVAEDSGGASRSRITEPGEQKCVNCATTQTPLWRKGPAGRNTLCNACGTRWKRFGTLVARGSRTITKKKRKKKKSSPIASPPPEQQQVEMRQPPQLVERVSPVRGTGEMPKRSTRTRRRTAKAQEFFERLAAGTDESPAEVQKPKRLLAAHAAQAARASLQMMAMADTVVGTLGRRNVDDVVGDGDVVEKRYEDVEEEDCSDENMDSSNDSDTLEAEVDEGEGFDVKSDGGCGNVKMEERLTSHGQVDRIAKNDRRVVKDEGEDIGEGNMKIGWSHNRGKRMGNVGECDEELIDGGRKTRKVEIGIHTGDQMGSAVLGYQVNDMHRRTGYGGKAVGEIKTVCTDELRGMDGDGKLEMTLMLQANGSCDAMGGNVEYETHAKAERSTLDKTGDAGQYVEHGTDKLDVSTSGGDQVEPRRVGGENEETANCGSRSGKTIMRREEWKKGDGGDGPKDDETGGVKLKGTLSSSVGGNMCNGGTKRKSGTVDSDGKRHDGKRRRRAGAGSGTAALLLAQEEWESESEDPSFHGSEMSMSESEWSEDEGKRKNYK